MAYVETSGKLDWALMFARTGKFPLDRSSMFSSYADALAYAKQDGTDSRKIGGTAYVGQIVTVYGPGADGLTEEVAAYIITVVGQSAALQKLAQSSATGDYGEDIANLQAAMSAAQEDIAEIQGKLIPASADNEGFMSAADKQKLDGVEAGAQANKIESVQVNGEPLVITGKAVNIDLTPYALKSEVASVFDFKGTKATVDELPQEDNTTGDVWLVEDEGSEYVWTGTEWEELGVTVDLSGYSTTEEMNAAITAAIQALDVTEVSVGASETISTISETDGKIAVGKQSIQIGISQVTDLQTSLDAKADADDIPTEFTITATSNDFAASGGANSVTINLTESDTPVGGKLTKNAAGNKLDFGGQISANGRVLTDNLGTVTSVTAGAGLTTGGENDPITGAGTISLAETGADSQSTSNEGRNYVQNITVDAYGRVTAIASAEVPESVDTVREVKVNGVSALGTTPSTGAVDFVAGDNITITAGENGQITIAAADAPVYTGSDGVQVADNVVSLADNGVTTAKIANAAVTDAKIQSLNVNKLTQTEGDTIILNGGNA